jgi:anthranilate synthase component 1
MSETFNLSFEEFKTHARTGAVVPLIRTVFAGDETPVGLYEKLSKGKSGTFLLESAEQGVWSRFSFIGVNSRASLRQTEGKLEITNLEHVLPTGEQLAKDSLEAIDQIQTSWTSASIADLPPLSSGLVGFFAWDIIRALEKLEVAPPKTYNSTVVHLELVRDLVVVDHKTSNLLLVSNIYCSDNNDLASEYSLAQDRINDMLAQISVATQPAISAEDGAASTGIKHLISNSEFIAMVEKAKEHVVAGDVFQVVLSQRFEIELNARPIDVYKVLRSLNPSPYMYLLNFEDSDGDYAIVGSSPEALVKVNNKHVVMHPIAGSRPRGEDTAADLANEESLKADAKERAEHLMLVDLARNDLLKVCKPDSIEVTEFMKIERFSHIMHLVSTVEGSLGAGNTPLDVFKATFPAGTLSGAPKPRALEIIDDLEQYNRGVFGGVVGYLDFGGNADLAICIRTAFMRGGTAHVQAGAGIVLDSVPQLEYEETVHKMGAVIAAIKKANQLFG